MLQTNLCMLQGALKDAGIVPSSEEVSTSNFLQALTNKFGYEPILFCDEDRSGNRYIDSVRSLSAPLHASSGTSDLCGRDHHICPSEGLPRLMPPELNETHPSPVSRRMHSSYLL